MENIEIKARIKNLQNLRTEILRLDHTYLGQDHQIDTYFETKQGRFKLRESTLCGPYLVLYFLEDRQGPRSSIYQMIPVTDPVDIKLLFSRMLGIKIIIEKDREIFLFDNIRIHLDQVSGLGSFLEFEAVLDENHQDRIKEKKRIENLLRVLCIDSKDLVSKSYRELLK
jgi:adenylate cyclase class 2